MSDAVITGLLGAAGIIVVAIIGWFSGRRSSKAQELSAITDGATKIAGKFESYSDRLEKRLDDLGNEVKCIRKSNEELEERTSSLEDMFDSAVAYIRTLLSVWPYHHADIPPAPDDLRDILRRTSDRK